MVGLGVPIFRVFTVVELLPLRVNPFTLNTIYRDFPRANLGPVIGPCFFPNRDRNSQIL